MPTCTHTLFLTVVLLHTQILTDASTHLISAWKRIVPVYCHEHSWVISDQNKKGFVEIPRHNTTKAFQRCLVDLTRLRLRLILLIHWDDSLREIQTISYGSLWQLSSHKRQSTPSHRSITEPHKDK